METTTDPKENVASEGKPKTPLLRLLVVALASFCLCLYGLIRFGGTDQPRRFPMAPGVSSLSEFGGEEDGEVRVNQIALNEGVKESQLSAQACLDAALDELAPQMVGEPLLREEGDMVGAMLRLQDGRTVYLRARPRPDGGSILRTMTGTEIAGEEDPVAEFAWLNQLPDNTLRVYAVRKTQTGGGRLLYCFESESGQETVLAYYAPLLAESGFTRQQGFEKQMQEQTGTPTVVYVATGWQVLVTFYEGKNGGCDYAILVQKTNAPPVPNP